MTMDFNAILANAGADTLTDVQVPLDQTPITVLDPGQAVGELGDALKAENSIVVLLLDVSGSMSTKDSVTGEARIELVKQAVLDFLQTNQIAQTDKDRCNLCIIAFDSKVTIVSGFSSMSQKDLEVIKTLEASGATALYSALTIGVLEARKRRNLLIKEGTSCFKPVLFLLTDGEPYGDDEMLEPCKKVLARYVDGGKMKLVIAGFADGLKSMKAMQELCQEKQLIALQDADAIKDLFQLITASVATLSSSNVTDPEIALAFEKAQLRLALFGKEQKLILG